jgi:large subunit ribosomal protein L25
MAVVKASKRIQIGSRVVSRLRKEGMIPAVIYGHGQATESITLNEHEVELTVRRGERLLELDLEGRKETAMVKEVQYDTYGQRILHIDLARVNLDERVHVTVPIILKGTPAGVSEQGGMLQQVAGEVTIEVTVRAMPEHIDVLVGKMKVGDHLTMADLPLPAEAKLLDDPELMVAIVTVVAEEEEAAPAEGEAQPEVIGEKKEEEGEESAEA